MQLFIRFRLNFILKRIVAILLIMNLKKTFKSLGITESEALDSWEDEIATTPEDEVRFFPNIFYLKLRFIKNYWNSTDQK